MVQRVTNQAWYIFLVLVMFLRELADLIRATIQMMLIILVNQSEMLDRTE